jgi:chaperonin GroEL
MTDESTKEIVFGDDARERILKGVEILADAVKITMGPRGQNVVIERPGNLPHLTKDGVTVARSINLRDRFNNLGVQMVKEAAQRTAEVAGDGTTASTVLAQALYKEGLKMIAAGHNSSDIIRGISKGVGLVKDELAELSVPISSDEEIVQIGTISANGESEIGEFLCKAMNEVGREGVITIEEAKGFDTTLDVVDGTEIDRGYLSPYFITNQDKMAADLENPLVFLTSKKICSLKEILPLLEHVHDNKRSILIVANDVDGEALQGLVVNKLKGTLNICAIRPPEFGELQISALGDLSAILGCEVYDDISDREIVVNEKNLGQCRRVVITKTKTTFVGSTADTDRVQKRLSSVRREIKDPTLLKLEAAALQRRVAMLSGGVAVLRVGGSTETELRERKDRVEDALHATQAAIDEGIVPGGGVALVRASKSLDKIIKTSRQDDVVGLEIVRRACEAPLLQIVRNSGCVPEIVLEKVGKLKGTKGYDAKNEKFVDMFESGIIDPHKVVRSSLQHAASAACNLLSVGCAMVNDQSAKDAHENPLVSFN